MAQFVNKVGGIFPKGSGKGLFGGAGALITLGALGYGLNAALFNGKKSLANQHNLTQTQPAYNTTMLPLNFLSNDLVPSCIYFRHLEYDIESFATRKCNPVARLPAESNTNQPSFSDLQPNAYNFLLYSPT